MNRQHLLLIIISMVLALIFIVMGAVMYPLPGSDSEAFIPAALSYQATRRLINPLWTLSDSGDTRFIWYPPLFPLLLGSLLWEPTAPAAYLILGILSAVKLILTTLLFYRVSVPDRNLTWRRLFTLVLCVSGVCTAFIAQQGGRPETLATLWLLLGLLLITTPPTRYVTICLGLLLGLMAATHPVAAVLSGLLISIYCGFYWHTGKALIMTFGIILIAFGTAWLMLVVSPNGVAATMQGIFVHSRIVQAQQPALIPDPYQFLIYYLRAPTASFYGAVLLLFVISGGVWLWSQRLSIAAPRLVYLIALLFLGAIYYLAIREPRFVYNFLFLAPLLYLPILMIEASRHFSPIVTFAWKTIVALSALGFIWHLLLLPFYLQNGVRFATAQAAYQEISTPGVTIGISASFWVLSNPADQVELWNPAPGKSYEVVILQQKFSADAAPPSLPGYTLVEDTYIARPPEIFGMALANTYPGYSYAVYIQDE